MRVFLIDTNAMSALALSGEIVTGDTDFLGCGVAVWTPATLRTHLQQHGRTID
jgi:hypothetical protein